MIFTKLIDFRHFHADSSFEGYLSKNNKQILANFNEAKLFEDDHYKVEESNCKEEDRNAMTISNYGLFLFLRSCQSNLSCHCDQLCDNN
jgi:hypothetical protein